MSIYVFNQIKKYLVHQNHVERSQLKLDTKTATVITENISHRVWGDMKKNLNYNFPDINIPDWLNTIFITMTSPFTCLSRVF